jgi:hypothetical protein
MAAHKEFFFFWESLASAWLLIFYLVLGHLISTAQQHIELSFDWPRQELSSLVFGSLLCFAIQAAAAPNNVFAVLIFGCAPRIPLGFSHSHRRSGLATSDSDSCP